MAAVTPSLNAHAFIGDMKLQLALQLAFMLVRSVTSESLSDPAVHGFTQEWHLWKADHEKSYKDDQEEVERHAVWMSNKEYIEQHNKQADELGFTLKMNQFGDLVSRDRYSIRGVDYFFHNQFVLVLQFSAMILAKLNSCWSFLIGVHLNFSSNFYKN